MHAHTDINHLVIIVTASPRISMWHAVRQQSGSREQHSACVPMSAEDHNSPRHTIAQRMKAPYDAELVMHASPQPSGVMNQSAFWFHRKSAML